MQRLRFSPANLQGYGNPAPQAYDDRHICNPDKPFYGVLMAKHAHRFVEEYDGLVGFGFDREGDENTLTYYLQKFSNDECMALVRERISQGDMEELFDLLKIEQVVPRSQVEYDAKIFGGELGPYERKV